VDEGGNVKNVGLGKVIRPGTPVAAASASVIKRYDPILVGQLFRNLGPSSSITTNSMQHQDGAIIVRTPHNVVMTQSVEMEIPIDAVNYCH
jgi:hypothetical protein